MKTKKTVLLLVEIVQGFYRKDGLQKASSLAYTFLMSFAPFFISIASIITLFIPANLYTQYENQIFTSYLPVVGKQVAKYMQNFQAHSLDLSIISLAVLFITSLLMINTLRYCMDQLLGFNESDLHIGLKLIIILAIFAGLILSGVILLGVHEVATHYLPRYSFTRFSFILSFLQYLSSFLAFSLIYKFVPHTPVLFRHAFIAGITAAVLFELAKFGFAIYIRSFSNAQNVLYGSLAAVPIFLLWLYIVSIIFLLGAQIISVLQSPQQS